MICELDFIPTKRRVRATRNGHCYTDRRNIEEANRIREAYKRQGGNMHEGPVAVFIDTYGKLPKSTPKRVNYEPNIRRPDADNTAKAILDALNGIAFEDDRFITKLSVQKHDRTRIDCERTVFKVVSA